MSRKKRVFSFNIEEAAVDFYNHLLQEKPHIPFFVPLILIAWAIERWVFSFSNWVPLALAVWATIQYGRYQRKLLVEDMDKKWQRIILNISPITPLEHCEWLNKLLTEIWSNYFNQKLSLRLSAIVESGHRGHNQQRWDEWFYQEKTSVSEQDKLHTVGFR